MRVQPPHHSFPGRRLPVPRHLLVLARHRGDCQIYRHGAACHQRQDGGQALQVQLGPQAVHRHPGQVCVSQRGRPHHPQPPLAGQEAR